CQKTARKGLSLLGIPRGFHHSAQGWSVATTLGGRPKTIFNPNGDLCKRRVIGRGARVCDPQRLDLQNGVLRLTEPRSAFAEISERVASTATIRFNSFQGSIFIVTFPG